MTSVLRAQCAAAVALGLAALGCGGDDDPGDSSKPKYVIDDPKTAHFGTTHSEWGAEWWKWLYELPQTSATSCVLPPDDPTGANCAYGQAADAPLFYLAGNFGGTTERSECVAPAGKPLFFPIVTYSSDNAGVPAAQQLDAQGLKDAATAWYDGVDMAAMSVEIDGKAVENLADFKADVTQYKYTVPAEPNTFSCIGVNGVTGVIEPAFSAGYFMMISGLTSGAHSLHFTAKVGGSGEPFVVDVKYALEVK